MSWNYRLVRDTHRTPDGEEQEWYTIREVYYAEDGRIESWTADGIAACGETWQECYDDLAMMGRAGVLPIVDVSSGEAVEIPLPQRKKGK